MDIFQFFQVTESQCTPKHQPIVKKILVLFFVPNQHFNTR